jgi:hypothetical protein
MHDQEGGANYWVVQHTTRSKKIVWGQHQFKVTADEESRKYTCECKHWEHTGMEYKIVFIYIYMKNIYKNYYDRYCFKGLFCVHILHAFMHLQIERIPK